MMKVCQVGKRVGKKGPRGRPKHRWEIILKHISKGYNGKGLLLD
jgi:hypothetical protein